MTFDEQVQAALDLAAARIAEAKSEMDARRNEMQVEIRRANEKAWMMFQAHVERVSGATVH